jgi:hypothetical protein
VPARPAATVEAQQADDYRRGREEGTAWARDFATVDELRDFVASFELSHDGDFGNQYWLGFFAAAQEVLDGFSRGQAAE